MFRGFTELVDDIDVFTNVIHTASIKVLFAYAAYNAFVMRHTDIESVFLHSEVDDDLYIRQPEGHPPVPGMMCKLQCALYDLRSASRRWHKPFVIFSTGITSFCSSVYRRSSIIKSVFVDDFNLVWSEL